MLELHVSKGYVSDHCVDAVLRKSRVTKVLDPDVLAWVKELCNPARDLVKLDADKPGPGPCICHEVSDPAAWLKNRRVLRYAKARDVLVNRRDDCRGGVEGVK